MTNDLTIGIISLNAEKGIIRALSSCRSVGRFLVIDNGSYDNTINKAKSLGAETYVFLPRDQKKIREFALSKCRTEWIFFIDTDEIVDKKSLAKILKAWTEKKNKYDGFWIARRNYYGKKKHEYLKYGLFYPDYQLRLIRRDITYKNTPHEEPDIKKNKTYTILKDAYITHYFDQKKLLSPLGFIKLFHFTRSYALYLKNKSSLYLLVNAFVKFIDLGLISLIRGKGILDGWRGVMAAWNFGLHVCSIYLYAFFLKTFYRK